jgi:hypothetical protein
MKKTLFILLKIVEICLIPFFYCLFTYIGWSVWHERRVPHDFRFEYFQDRLIIFAVFFAFIVFLLFVLCFLLSTYFDVTVTVNDYGISNPFLFAISIVFLLLGAHLIVIKNKIIK